MMKAVLRGAALLLGLGLAAPVFACELDRPLKMAGLDYDSAAFHTAVASAIAEKGFGCKVERVPGVIAPLVNGLGRGDVDIVMEIWLANPVEAWVKDRRPAGSSRSARRSPMRTKAGSCRATWSPVPTPRRRS